MNDPDNLHQCLARETLENTRGLIFWVRPDGTFPWVNPAVCVALGYTAAEFDDLRASDILADYAPDERLKLRREISTGGALAVRATLMRKDGTTFPVESHNQIVTIDGVKYNCANCHDISADLSARARPAGQPRPALGGKPPPQDRLSHRRFAPGRRYLPGSASGTRRGPPRGLSEFTRAHQW